MPLKLINLLFLLNFISQIYCLPSRGVNGA
jgi:hypothetical protein